MAERTVIVCDSCGEIAAERVSIRAGGRALQKDLCATHLAELLRGANPARRGRPPATMTGTPTPAATASAPKRRGRPPKAAATSTAGARRRSRRGSADSSASASTAKASRPRRKITDPAILEKRRAALAKARKALADKRAAAAKAG
jgi:hypothetical protein